VPVDDEDAPPTIHGCRFINSLANVDTLCRVAILSGKNTFGNSLFDAVDPKLAMNFNLPTRVIVQNTTVNIQVSGHYGAMNWINLFGDAIS